MPRYDYECISCGHEFELRQTFQEAGVGACPKCSSKARRKFHAVPVIYKGSGFYTTDYGRPKTPPVEGAKDKEAKETNDTKGSKETKDTKESNKEAKEAKKETKASAEKDSSGSDKTAAKSTSKAKT